MYKAAGWMLGLGVLAGLAGCEATARSDRCEPGWQTTASYERIQSTPVQPSPIQPRRWSDTQANYEAPVVTHFGSYFEDPFVTTGDGDDALGWTWVDLLAVPYGPARFAVNTVAVPLSLVKEPPCVLQTTNLDQPVGECGVSDRTGDE